MKNNTWNILQQTILETLEDRRLMSSVTLADGVLSLQGDPAAATTFLVTPEATNSKMLSAHVTGQPDYTVPAASVSEIRIVGGNGGDYVFVDHRITTPTTIETGNGNDTIRGGGGNESISSGGGNDLIYTRNGSDAVQTGDGNDTILGGSGNDIIHLGNGNDLVLGSGGHDCVVGGAGNDTIVGHSGQDTLIAGSGNDLLDGSAGNDSIVGGAGNDTLIGGGQDVYSNAGPHNVVLGFSTSGNTHGVGSAPGGSVTGGTGTTTSTTTTSGSSTSATGGTVSGGVTITPPAKTVTATPTTSTTTTPASGSSTTKSTGSSNTNVNAQAPVPKISMVANLQIANLALQVNALSGTLGVGDPTGAKYQWNFGDPNGQYNTMVGWNASHVYDTAGTYTITLTVTNSGSISATTTMSVAIAAAQRRILYVDPTNGSDANAGTNINAPLQSLARAVYLTSDDTEILLKAGTTLPVTSSLTLNSKDVVIGRYGEGADPILMRQVGNGTSTLAFWFGSDGVTVQNITFDSPYSADSVDDANKIGVTGMYLRGSNFCIRDCTFLNLDDAINDIGSPQGVMVMDCTAPLATGLRGYFIWGSGSDQVYIGNTDADSTREHDIRMVSLDRVLVADNNLTIVGDDGITKGCIEVHMGTYAYVTGNTCTNGDIRVGPRGGTTDPVNSSDDFDVVEDNTLNNTQINVYPGSHNLMIRNNIIYHDNSQAINIDGPDSQGRESGDITIENNTAISTGTAGEFVKVWGAVNGIALENNLWVAPNLVAGAGTAPVDTDGTDLSIFTIISNNVWPVPADSAANGGINYAGSTLGFQTPAQWNAQSVVQNDTFENVPGKDVYSITLNGATVGAVQAKAA